MNPGKSISSHLNGLLAGVSCFKNGVFHNLTEEVTRDGQTWPVEIIENRVCDIQPDSRTGIEFFWRIAAIEGGDEKEDYGFNIEPVKSTLTLVAIGNAARFDMKCNDLNFELSYLALRSVPDVIFSTTDGGVSDVNITGASLVTEKAAIAGRYLGGFDLDAHFPGMVLFEISLNFTATVCQPCPI